MPLTPNLSNLGRFDTSRTPPNLTLRTRNEGVPGSSPGVGSGESPAKSQVFARWGHGVSGQNRGPRVHGGTRGSVQGCVLLRAVDACLGANVSPNGTEQIVCELPASTSGPVLARSRDTTQPGVTDLLWCGRGTRRGRLGEGSPFGGRLHCLQCGSGAFSLGRELSEPASTLDRVVGCCCSRCRGQSATSDRSAVGRSSGTCRCRGSVFRRPLG